MIVALPRTVLLFFARSLPVPAAASRPSAAARTTSAAATAGLEHPQTLYTKPLGWLSRLHLRLLLFPSVGEGEPLPLQCMQQQQSSLQ